MSLLFILLNINNIITTIIGLTAASFVLYCCFSISLVELKYHRYLIMVNATNAILLSIVYTFLQLVIIIILINTINIYQLWLILVIIDIFPGSPSRKRNGYSFYYEHTCRISDWFYQIHTILPFFSVRFGNSNTFYRIYL